MIPPPQDCIVIQSNTEIRTSQSANQGYPTCIKLIHEKAHGVHNWNKLSVITLRTINSNLCDLVYDSALPINIDVSCFVFSDLQNHTTYFSVRSILL